MFPCAALFLGFKHCAVPSHLRCEKAFPHTTLHMLSSHFPSCLLTQVLQLIFSLISFSGANPSSLLSSLATFFCWLSLCCVALVSLKLMGRNVLPASAYCAAGTIGVCHHTQLDSSLDYLLFSYNIYILKAFIFRCSYKNCSDWLLFYCRNACSFLKFPFAA